MSNRLEYKSAALEVKAAAEGDGSTFEGHGAFFSNIDGGGDMLAPDAYDGMLGPMRAQGVVRNEHAVTTGKVTESDTVPGSLRVKAKISDTTDGRNQKILLKDGVYKFLSVGHFVKKARWLEGEGAIEAAWKEQGYTPSETDKERASRGLPIRLVMKAEPREVSTTWLPMNERASILSVKASGQPGGLTFDDHFAATLESADEFLQRLAGYLDTKSGSGRAVPPGRRAQAKALSDRLASILVAIDAGPAKGVLDIKSGAEDLALFDRFLAIQARLSDHI
jgi:hypothetical protein